MKKFVLLAVLILGCAGYRNDYGLDFQNAYKGLAVIEFKAVLETEKLKREKEWKAIGIVLEDGKVLALTHATSVPLREEMNTPFGTFILEWKTKTERFFIDGEEIKLIGRNGDISLFQSSIKTPFPIPFGDSDELKVGDKVMVIGFSGTILFNAKDGIVSALDVGKYGLPVKEETLLHSAPVNKGDSGSPLIAFKYGKPEIVGIVNAMIQDEGMGFAIKINDVKKAIKEVEK